MSDHAAIADKLAILRDPDAVFDAGGRVIGRDIPLLSAILREVDDTVLDRTLVVRIGDVTLRLAAGGRRLRGIIAISPAVPQTMDAVGQVLSPDDSETVQAVGQAIAAVCGMAATATVRAQPPQTFGSQAQAGVTSQRLMRDWAGFAAEQPASLIGRFLAAQAAMIFASYHVAGDDPAETTGDPATLEAVWTAQLSAFRQRHAALTGASPACALMCFDGALDGAALVLAINGDEQALLSCGGDALPAMMAAWNRLTA